VSILTTDAVSPSETAVNIYHTARWNISEDTSLHTRRLENVKFRYDDYAYFYFPLEGRHAHITYIHKGDTLAHTRTQLYSYATGLM
jgi:hypothetical protein